MVSPVEAFRFLSVIPLPGGSEEGGHDLTPAVAWFPLVGCALGGLLVLTDWACRKAFGGGSGLLAAALVLAVYAIFSGGLHHDGLIDVADAFLSSRPADERLRIMKDPYVGAMGITVLVLFLLVEFSAIYSLETGAPWCSGEFRMAALFAFPVLGRWVMSYLCVRFPYARRTGTAARMVEGSRGRHLAIATLITLVALAVSFLLLARVALLIAVLFVFALAFAEISGRLFTRSLGGITGDVIGATAMTTECLVLLIMASRLPELLARCGI